MELWREGRIKPVLNRVLLVQYLRMLKSLGLPETLLRRWAWWWNSKAQFITGEPAESLSALTLCSWIAKAGAATCVVYSGHAFTPPLVLPQSPPVWKTARSFLQELGTT